MSYLITAVVFILVFSVLILIHEFGHFIMAKKAGIKVEEFGFGLPPRLWGKKKGETIYSINWIPFGGFVRMLGEDQTDAKMLKNSRSFAAKPMRARVLVIIAGVVMNFLLAWLLMIVVFSVGVKPMLSSEEEFMQAVSKGKIVLEAGAKFKTVEGGSLAEGLGMKVGDDLYSFNNKPISDFVLADMFKNPVGKYKVVRSGQILNFEIGKDMMAVNLPTGKSRPFGVTFYDALPFPRVKIFSMRTDTVAYQAGLRPNDVVLTVNGQQIYTVEQYESLFHGVKNLQFSVYRDGLVLNFVVERKQAKQVIISEVLPGSPADKSSVMSGDVVISVNGKEMVERTDLINFISEHKTEKLSYLIERNGQRLFFQIPSENGKIGVLLSELIDYGSAQNLSFYDVGLFSSIVDVKDQKYTFPAVIYKSLGETWKLSKLTANMFVSFVGNFFSKGEIPQTVAGPVGIARMTHGFVQEGLIPLLYFVAILSLSLAVVNILPFPALDGGRLLFVLIELIIGRRVSQKWESWIHGFGYLLILILILAVTYSDIAKLFVK